MFANKQKNLLKQLKFLEPQNRDITKNIITAVKNYNIFKQITKYLQVREAKKLTLLFLIVKNFQNII